jgi:ubiquinol-cytochrome c reductase cytochrome b subunit
MHGWGSNFIVAIVLIHMVQVFLFGAYKFPRELTWIVGVFLLLMTLGMAFSGQVLRFDQDASLSRFFVLHVFVIPGMLIGSFVCTY